MTNSLGCRYFSNSLTNLRVLFAVAVTCCLVNISSAAINGDYNIMIGESPRYLDAILKFQRQEITASELYMIKYEESCKNPSIRLHDRNRPALLLQNTSNQDNFISSFVINLQEAGYEFGTGDIANDWFNGNLILQDPRSDAGVTVTANYLNGDTTKLQLNFTGLGQGKAAIFRIDLDPAPMNNVAFPDYRGIMLGANVGGGATNPALLSATFSMTGMPNATTIPKPFTADISGTISSGMLEVYLSQARTDMFDQNGSTEIPDQLAWGYWAAVAAGRESR
jgi:hypothetical protein